MEGDDKIIRHKCKTLKTRDWNYTVREHVNSRYENLEITFG